MIFIPEFFGMRN